MADDVNVDRVDEYGSAPSVNSNGTSATQTQQAQTTQQAAAGAKPNLNTGAAPETQGFYDLSRSLGLASNLSPEGQKFLEVIDTTLTDKNVASRYGWHVDVLPISVIRDSRAIVVNGKAVILILAETNPTNENLPTIRFERKAAEELIRLRPNVRILMTIVITKEDYINANKFATYIRNMFVVAGERSLTLEAIKKDTSFTFGDSVEEYEKAYAELNPHAIPLRHDLCFTIYQVPKNQNNYRYNAYEEAQVYNHDDLDDRTPFATIGGYVEFIKDGAYAYKYLPIVHISEISVRYPDAGLIPLLLIVATKRFITARAWQIPYRQMRADKHGSVMNLGALFPDGNGGRWVISKPEDFDKTIMSSFADAQIVLDVTAGRAMIPGLIFYADPTPITIKNLIQLYANTFGVGINTPPVAPFARECPFYRGYYPFGNTKLDSANIDFLSEYSRHPNKVTDCERLLVQKVNPEERAAEDRSFEANVEFYYRTDVIGLSPALLSELDHKLADNKFSFQGLTQMSGIYNISGYKARAEEWGKYQSMNSAGTYNNFIPTSGIYTW